MPEVEAPAEVEPADARGQWPAHSATAAEAPPRMPGDVGQQRRAARRRRQLQPIASGHHAGHPSTADPGGRKRVRIPPWLPRLPSARASASMKLRCSSARVAWARCTAPAIPGSIDRSRSRPCRRPLWRIPTASVGSSRKREPPGSLNHPNVLTLYDIGTHEGAPYLVCELLEGATLRDLLRAGDPAPAASDRLCRANRARTCRCPRARRRASRPQAREHLRHSTTAV